MHHSLLGYPGHCSVCVIRTVAAHSWPTWSLFILTEVYLRFGSKLEFPNSAEILSRSPAVLLQRIMQHHPTPTSARRTKACGKELVEFCVVRRDYNQNHCPTYTTAAWFHNKADETQNLIWSQRVGSKKRRWFVNSHSDTNPRKMTHSGEIKRSAYSSVQNSCPSLFIWREKVA